MRFKRPDYYVSDGDISLEDALSVVMDPHDYHDSTDRLNDKLSQIRSVISQLVVNLHAQGILTDDFVETLVSPHFRKAGD